MACDDESDAGREVGAQDTQGSSQASPDLEEKASVELVVGGGWCDRQRSFRNHEVYGLFRNNWQYSPSQVGDRTKTDLVRRSFLFVAEPAVAEETTASHLNAFGIPDSRRQKAMDNGERPVQSHGLQCRMASSSGWGWKENPGPHLPQVELSGTMLFSLQV